MEGIDFIIGLLTLPSVSTVVTCMGMAPPPAKADQMGDKYGNFFAYIRLANDVTNAAYQVLMIEKHFPVQTRSERKAMPLFGPSPGVAFTHSQLDALLPQLLRAVITIQPDLLVH